MNRYENLAYDYSNHEEYSPEHINNKEKEEKRKQNGMKGKAKNDDNRAEKTVRRKKKKINTGILVSILSLSLSAGFMISEFVTVNEKRDEAAQLEEKLETTEAATSQKKHELDESVDRNVIMKEATTRLGMQTPEKYQIIYINVPREDVTNTTANSVEGMNNSVKNFFSKMFSDIVEFFSIK